MKTLLKFIGVAALLATVTARAQQDGYPLVPVSLALPSVILAANDPTNFASPFLIDFKKINVTTISFTLSCKASTNMPVSFTGAWSSDGVTLDTNNVVTLGATAGAGSLVEICTNTLTSNGRRYFYLLSETGAGGGNITNNAAGYGQITSPW